uniref:Protein kinase domain-containing protein n=2 Tax=Macrostomum lignano TaxID=282301 RepID=A0A1I8J3Y4_9PLAT
YCRYVLGREIGIGSYSKVLVGHGPDGPVALKQIRVSNSSGLPYSTMRELVILKPLSKLRHQNIVALIDVLLQQHGKDYYLFLVFELLHCDLQIYLSRHRMGPSAVRNLGHQLMLGLDFLHRHRIVHRDLKPQNCLLNQQCTVLKIADFNMARACSWEKQMTAVVSTLWYRSPEVLLAYGYSSPTDVWSAGCILFEMAANGKSLFNAQKEAPMLRQILALLGVPSAAAWPAGSAVARQPLAAEFPPELPASAVAACLAARLPTGLASGLDGGCGYTGGRWSLASLLGERLLRFSPLARCTAAEALRHPYFAGAGAVAESADAAADAAAADVVESVVRNVGINSPFPMPPPQQQSQTLFPVPRWALGAGASSFGAAAFGAHSRGRASMPAAAPFSGGGSFRQKRPASSMMSEEEEDNVERREVAEEESVEVDDIAWASDEQLEEFSSSNESQAGLVGMVTASSEEQSDSSFKNASQTDRLDGGADQMLVSQNSENNPPALPEVAAAAPAQPQASCFSDLSNCGGKLVASRPPPPPPLPLRQRHARRFSF